jgi:hypothetical protein
MPHALPGIDGVRLIGCAESRSDVFENLCGRGTIILEVREKHLAQLPSNAHMKSRSNAAAALVAVLTCHLIQVRQCPLLYFG